MVRLSIRLGLAALIVGQSLIWLARAGAQDPKKATVAELIAGVRAAEPATRRESILALAQRGEQAKPATAALIGALGDPDANVRAAAIWALGKLRLEPNTTIPALVKSLEDKGRGARLPHWQLAALALGEYGEAAMPHLLKALQSDNTQVCSGAAIAAYRIGPAAKDAVPLLIQVLEKDDPATRRYMLHGLLGIGPEAKAAVPAAVKMLSSDDFHTQYWACRVLGAIGPDASSATAELIDLVEHGVASVRRNAAAALGNIGPQVGELAVSVLIEALRDPNQVVREDAVIALGKLGPLAAPAAPVIEQLLQRDTTFAPRAEAAKTLWLLDPMSRTPAAVLLRELQAPDRPWTAAHVLGQIGPAAGVIDEVVAVLESDSPLARQYAAEALGRMGPAAARARTALEALRETDKDDEVRAAAAEALRQIEAARTEQGDH